jgi:hypothetical protein
MSRMICVSRQVIPTLAVDRWCFPLVDDWIRKLLQPKLPEAESDEAEVVVTTVITAATDWRTRTPRIRRRTVAQVKVEVEAVAVTTVFTMLVRRPLSRQHQRRRMRT